MTRVTRATACLAGASIVVGLVAVPATADSEYGSTAARDGILHHGCRDYVYRYRVTAPTDDWTLETFLRDPTGDSIASGTYLADSDPHEQRARFRFCRYATRPGVFRIRALLHWYDDAGEHRAWLEPTRFRLRRSR